MNPNDFPVRNYKSAQEVIEVIRNSSGPYCPVVIATKPQGAIIRTPDSGLAERISFIDILAAGAQNLPIATTSTTISYEESPTGVNKLGMNLRTGDINHYPEFNSRINIISSGGVEIVTAVGIEEVERLLKYATDKHRPTLKGINKGNLDRICSAITAFDRTYKNDPQAIVDPSHFQRYLN